MASAISFSSIFLSEADEKKDFDKLTDAEKESILDDKYGRQRTSKTEKTESSNNNNNRDYESLVEELFSELDKMPAGESGNFWRAMIFPHDQWEMECDLHFFLQRENFDTKRAARRICEYWNTRVEIFGRGNAFEPLTLQSDAMKDVLPIMDKKPGLFRILPNDDHGRTVICWERTNNTSFKDYDDIAIIKILWFVSHQALQKQSTKDNGVVLIIIRTSSSWDFPSQKYVKLVAKTIESLPFKICCTHVCFSSIMISLILPMAKAFFRMSDRLRYEIHNTINIPKVIKEMQTFGLRRENLPTAIGGTYDEKSPWIDSCRRILKVRAKRRREEQQ